MESEEDKKTQSSSRPVVKIIRGKDPEVQEVNIARNIRDGTIKTKDKPSYLDQGCF